MSVLRITTLLICAWTNSALAGGVPVTELDPLEVIGTAPQVLPADATAAGIVTNGQIQMRPLLRPAELLENVPGMVVTQHSGLGKANQYFLRGFNLDHGTDFAVFVDGVPANMRTHGHGQGYTDLNFLIPELVDSIAYRKGPYAAAAGDFSAAGSAELRLVGRPASSLSLDAGLRGFGRALGIVGGGSQDTPWFAALEAAHDEGPFEPTRKSDKLNLWTKTERRFDDVHVAASLMAYDANWDSADQIPLRAVRSGALDRYGLVDTSDAGETRRFGLNLSAHDHAAGWNGNVYALDYRLRLFSNFTYFLDDPANGDQFEQADHRQVYGLNAQRVSAPGRNWLLELGTQLRHDQIGEVGLYRTRQRQRLSTVREDAVAVTSAAVHAAARWAFVRDWSATLGLRGDYYRASVDASLPANGGAADDHLFSPRFTVAWRPLPRTLVAINAGRGFHSNDARGTTITVDPADGVTPVERLDLLVPVRSVEAGITQAVGESLTLSLTAFDVRLDSELVFVGDAGGTEAGPASRRRGLESSLIYRPAAGLIADLDFAYTRAQARGTGPADHIPGAVERVASLGLAWDDGRPLSGGLRLRYLGPAPLLEDNSVRSEDSLSVNALLRWRFSSAVELNAEALNLLDRKDPDISYFYASQLPGEAGPVDDVHVHPMEPFTVRAGLKVLF